MHTRLNISSSYTVFQNLPFGETMVELGGIDYDNPYKFNGKELDEETGNYYYGARYYNPKVSQWLSVDPLAEKYAGFSPYNYTLNNPVMLVDPNGMSVDPFTKVSQNTSQPSLPSTFTPLYIATSGPGDPPKVNTGSGTAVGDNVTNLLPEVLISCTSKGSNYENTALSSLPMVMYVSYTSEAAVGTTTGVTISSAGITEVAFPVLPLVLLAYGVSTLEYKPRYRPTSGPISTVIMYDKRPSINMPKLVLLPTPPRHITIDEIGDYRYFNPMAQRGKTNWKETDIEGLEAKEKAGTLTKKEKQKLKRHRKNKGLIGSRWYKGGSKR